MNTVEIVSTSWPDTMRNYLVLLVLRGVDMERRASPPAGSFVRVSSELARDARIAEHYVADERKVPGSRPLAAQKFLSFS
jgi:hypothetical protein